MQGVAGSEKRFGDPVEAALRWQEAGAEWIHLVDLDAAFGRGHNRELQAEIVGRLDIHVEMSGGIRDDESLAAAMATGCRRVNIGTAALEQPEWCARAIAEYGDRVAVGLDVRGRTLAARGWTREGGDLYDVLARLDGEGCARYVVTDVNKDGMLAGPEPPAAARRLRRDRPAGRRLAAASPSSPTCEALMGLVADGVEGAIIGTALYEGRFTLEEALALTRGAAMTLAVRVIPCLDVDAGRVVKGINFQELRDAGDPVELARAYDAEGADELTFLDISASHEGRATTMEIVSRHRRAGLHPADRRRGSRPASTTSTGCCAPAPTRSRSTPPRSTGPSWSPRSPTGSATRCWCSRSTPAARPGTDSGFEVTTHGGRKSAGLDAIEWAARAAELGAGEILLNAMDADGTQDGFDLELIRAVRREVTDPGDRLAAARARSSTSRRRSRPAPTPCSPPRVFHFGTLRIADVKAALAAAGHPVR